MASCGSRPGAIAGAPPIPGEGAGKTMPKPESRLETHPERPFLANDDIENKGLLGREIAKKRLSG
jgi:hypothetical protein